MSPRAEANNPDALAAARAKPKRKPLPEHLPRQDVLHQPAGDGACVCPACDGGMGRLGEDVTEMLGYVPGHFQVIRNVRPKYACQACDAITQAPVPAMPTPCSRATSAMLAHLLVSNLRSLAAVSAMRDLRPPRYGARSLDLVRLGRPSRVAARPNRGRYPRACICRREDPW